MEQSDRDGKEGLKMDRYEHRKSTCVLRLTDENGAPLQGKTIHAELKKHEFLFGTGGFFAVPMTSPELPAERREWPADRRGLSHPRVREQRPALRKDGSHPDR